MSAVWQCIFDELESKGYCAVLLINTFDPIIRCDHKYNYHFVDLYIIELILMIKSIVVLAYYDYCEGCL